MQVNLSPLGIAGLLSGMERHPDLHQNLSLNLFVFCWVDYSRPGRMNSAPRGSRLACGMGREYESHCLNRTGVEQPAQFPPPDSKENKLLRERLQNEGSCELFVVVNKFGQPAQAEGFDEVSVCAHPLGFGKVLFFRSAGDQHDK